MTTMSRSVPGSADPVKAVSVISTGTVRIHPDQVYGTRQPLYWWLLASRQWTPPRPINVYVIEHARRPVLFDTGQDGASVADTDHFPGGFTGYLYHRLARFHIGEVDILTAQPHRATRHPGLRRQRRQRDRVPPARGPHRRTARADRLGAPGLRPRMGGADRPRPG